jgi:hypothetical protein
MVIIGAIPQQGRSHSPKLGQTTVHAPIVNQYIIETQMVYHFKTIFGKFRKFRIPHLSREGILSHLILGVADEAANLKTSHGA